MENRGKVKAYANIALIKYWGKRDEKLILPMNSSLSLTLDCFYTETEVIFNNGIGRDYFYLDGNIQGRKDTERIGEFLNLFRQSKGIHSNAIVRSNNNVPTAAGLASSASGFAALAGAANIASGLNLNKRELSIYARRGSGSATRSIYGGFVEWKKGTGDKDSFAIPIDDGNWDIGMIIVMVNVKEKAVSSREGMKRTVETSPFYGKWVEEAEKDLTLIKKAIRKRNFQQIGAIAEKNSLRMHGTMLGADPPLSYWESGSIMTMQLVRELRAMGIDCYFTMDAGPNVKIICRLSESHKIKRRLSQYFHENQIITARPGPGITIL